MHTLLGGVPVITEVVGERLRLSLPTAPFIGASDAYLVVFDLWIPEFQERSLFR